MFANHFKTFLQKHQGVKKKDAFLDIFLPKFISAKPLETFLQKHPLEKRTIILKKSFFDVFD